MKVVKFSAALFIGSFMMLAVTSQVASAKSSAAPASQGSTVPRLSSPLTYAWVITNNVQVYAKPGDTTPVRDLGAGFLYVSLTDARPIVVGDQKWYQINKGEYVKATDIAIVRPSAFEGITLTAAPDKPFGWMMYWAKTSANAGEPAAKEGQALQRYIGDLKPDIQAKLLRALQEREIERVGGARPIPVDLRVICATNRSLDKLVAPGASGRTSTGASRWSPSNCRRCGPGARTSASWPSTSWRVSPPPTGGPRRPSPRAPPSCWSATPGPATSASWRTSSSGWRS